MSLTVTELLDLGPFAMNSYLVSDATTCSALLIDPGAEADQLLAAWQRSKCQLRHIIFTHAHLDHVLAAPEVLEAVVAAKEGETCQVWLPAADEELYQGLAQQCTMFGLPPMQPLSHYNHYNDGWRVPGTEFPATAKLTPGHSPGSSILYFKAQGWLFGGDLLFFDSIGRTDLWGGDMATMRESLRYLLTLPEATKVFPGHGPVTTLARERRHNPFLRELL